MNKKFCDILFYLICATLCFVDIPTFLRCEFVFGSISSKLAFYPLFVALVYTLYCQLRYKNVFVDWNKFKWFVYIYIALTIVSIIWGLYSFPYWQELLDVTNLKSSHRYQMIHNLLQACGFNISYEWVQKFLLGSYPLRTFLKNFFYSFGTAYMVYCWYKTDWQRGFKVMMVGCMIGLFIVMAYGILDIFYLAHSQTATELLKLINPYIHEICTNHGWWPPLLGHNGLRSVFAEPCFLGAWSTFVIPFLLFGALITKKLGYKILNVFVLTFFFFEMFLTQSRSCIAVLFVEVLFICLCIVWQYKKEFIKKVIMLTGIVAIAFSFCILFYDKYMYSQVNNSTMTNSSLYLYVDNNFNSMVGTDKRSNGARWAMTCADLQTFKDSPVFGVGVFFRNSYIDHKFPQWALSINEVVNWIKYHRGKGSSYPELTEYSSRLANYGIVGFILFFFPLMFVYFKFLKKCYQRQSSLQEIVCLTGFTGLLAVGVAYKFSNLIGYYCLLGMAYAVLYGKKPNPTEL
ncbi:MAG: O-antigen ligase family protein [Phascolarctobacterium sp.]|nr:O-antigen ligase family protein [Candidatus Phascolarctobacterium caballi]